MFYYLNGIVAVKEPYLAVIDCGGVGYACHTTQYTLGSLERGKEAKLYTYVHVREESFDIYGFSSLAEKNSFEMLLAVSGVGPKAALSILSAGTPESLAMAIVTGDEKKLTAAPGVGKKLAQRIILELKDRISKEREGAVSAGIALPEIPSQSGKLEEATTALAVLGYSQADINFALKGLDLEQLSLEDVIRQALKRMIR